MNDSPSQNSGQAASSGVQAREEAVQEAVQQMQNLYAQMEPEAEEHEEATVQTLRDRICALENQLAEITTAKPIFCCYFARKGRCKHGLHCKFLHEGPGRIWQVGARYPIQCERVVKFGGCKHRDAWEHP